MMQADAPVVDVDGLSIDYKTPGGTLHAVQDVTFSIARGEVLGLVGESGCGKSTVAMAMLGHLGSSGSVANGRVVLQSESLLTLPPSMLSARRGKLVGFVPQDPTTALSPHLTVGSQYAEIALHHGVATNHAAALALACEQFSLVGLPNPPRLIRRYPHELSGGQQQRVCIAMAIACRPKLLVLDEPTTGLDVTTQARIVALLRDLQTRLDMAMLYVTHDLGILGQIASRVGVMYAGQLVELASVEVLFTAPRHPYSRGLMASVQTLDENAYAGQPLRGLLQRDQLPAGCPFFPRCDYAEPSCAQNVQRLTAVESRHWVACQRWEFVRDELPVAQNISQPSPSVESGKGHALIEIRHLSLSYGKSSAWRRWFAIEPPDVVKDISLTIAAGEIFGLVGESGSGKSTTARAISGLLEPRLGTIRFMGAPLQGRLRQRPLNLKRQIQFIFQNPDASLNPRERVRKILARPLRLFFGVSRGKITTRAQTALTEVHLDPSYVARFSDQLSGGERQRVAIARALVAQPSLILCDEVLSALDVSVQRNIVELLSRLRQETKAAMLFISHDIAVVRHLADRIGVLFDGTLVECGPTAALFEPPFHPYTEELLLAVPSFKARSMRSALASGATRPRQSGQGCVYAGRCRHHLGPVCDTKEPPWQEGTDGHVIRCHIPLAELATASLLVPPDGTENHGSGSDKSRLLTNPLPDVLAYSPGRGAEDEYPGPRR
jgi:peptide/nickel transport system ATP-binding protein